jgi:hypothetical protein
VEVGDLRIQFLVKMEVLREVETEVSLVLVEQEIPHPLPQHKDITAGMVEIQVELLAAAAAAVLIAAPGLV